MRAHFFFGRNHRQMMPINPDNATQASHFAPQMAQLDVRRRSFPAAHYYDICHNILSLTIDYYCVIIGREFVL